MKNLLRFYCLVMFLLFSRIINAQTSNLIKTNEYVFQRPDPIWQSIAGGAIYTTSFFLLNGSNIIHNYDSISHKSEYGIVPTLALSSFFSACAVAVVGDLTATRNGGSYLSTLTIDWIASLFVGSAVNAIYTGRNPSIRFLITTVPSVGIIVLMNQLYFDPTKKEIHFREDSGILGNFMPLLESKFIGISFQKKF